MAERDSIPRPTIKSMDVKETAKFHRRHSSSLACKCESMIFTRQEFNSCRVLFFIDSRASTCRSSGALAYLIIYLQHCASPALLVRMLMVDFQNDSDKPTRCIRPITHTSGYRQLTDWCWNEYYDWWGDIPTTYNQREEGPDDEYEFWQMALDISSV